MSKHPHRSGDFSANDVSFDVDFFVAFAAGELEGWGAQELSNFAFAH
jgi:hypothetical protein